MECNTQSGGMGCLVYSACRPPLEYSLGIIPRQLASALPSTKREAGTIEVSLATGERVVIAADASSDLVRVIVAALRSTCLTLSPAVRIYFATGATDLRRSIDGLSALVRDRFTLNPLSGHLPCFAIDDRTPSTT
jgi:hypothetical protein